MSSPTMSREPGAGPGHADTTNRPPAQRTGTAALLWLIGIPVAAVLLILWQFVVQTSAEFNAAERVTGWNAVLRDLPASLLLLVPVSAGLVLGVRSARYGSRRGRVAIWLHGAGLFVVLWIAVSNLLGEVRPDDSVTLEKALVPAEVLAAAAVLGLSLLVARRPAPTGAAHRTTRRHRYALLAPALALAGAFGWLAAAQAVLTHDAGGFARAGVPGTIVVTAERATSYVVYAEANAPTGEDELGVRVTGPSGSAVPADVQAGEAAYLIGWRGGWPVATFTTRQAGSYRVQITANVPPVSAPHAPRYPNGTVAVGEDVTGSMRLHERGSALLLLAGAVAAIALATTGQRPPSSAYEATSRP